MPSLLHETLVSLFRDRITLAPELIQQGLGIELPTYTEVRAKEADLTQIVPTEYRADLVVLLSDKKPVYGIVVEVQLARDSDKPYSWPLYAAALRAQLRCPTAVLVVAPDATVARWAAQPIDLGASDNTFAPLVIGSDLVPRITDSAQATEAPELAVLSALAHGNEEGGIDVVAAALLGASSLDDLRAALYYDLVMASLNEAARKALMANERYEFQTDFAKKYFSAGREEGREKGREEGREKGREEGRAEGQAQMLLKTLDRRGLVLSDERRALVLACKDLDQLDRWFDRALDATSVEQVFAAD